MGNTIPGGYYANNACYDGSALPNLPSSELPDPEDSPECARQEAEFLAAETVCVGSAIWTVGSLPSVAGAVGGALATIGSCGYTMLKAGDRDEACGIAPSPPKDPMAMDRPMDKL